MPVNIKHFNSLIDVKSFDRTNRTLTALVSTPAVDRDREILEPRAFEKSIKSFMENPVMLAGHQQLGSEGQPLVIGSWQELTVTKEGLLGTVQFADTTLGEEYWKLYSGGHMRGFSVGFAPVRSGRKNMKVDGNDVMVRVFTEVELIEISAVAIPANREALVQLAASLNAEKELPVALIAQIEKAVSAALEKQFNTEPGGKMHMLIEDVVENVYRSLDHGDPFDDDIQNDATHAKSAIPNVDDGDLADLQKALNEAACKMQGD